MTQYTREQYISRLVEKYNKSHKNANIAMLIYFAWRDKRYSWLVTQEDREELYRDFCREVDRG